MEQVTSSKSWTDEEVMNLTDVEGKSELVNGELIMVPTGFLHGILTARLIEALQRFAETQDLGFVGDSGLGCRMRNGNLRSPDVSFIPKDRAMSMGKDIVGFLQGAPDLAVEILSPSDRMYELKQKAREYFDEGCRLCWIVDPWTRIVLVMLPDGSEAVLTSKDTLDGGTLLPGFSFPVANLFEGLDY